MNYKSQKYYQYKKKNQKENEFIEMIILHICEISFSNFYDIYNEQFDDDTLCFLLIALAWLCAW